MSWRKVVVVKAKYGLRTIPVPAPAEDEILVFVKAVSLNHSDTLYPRGPLNYSVRVIGSELAGYVARRGARASQWKIDDHVAGFVQGATAENSPSAFAEYTTLKADLAIRIPENVSYEQASTVPLSSLAAAQMLFLCLGLNAPFPHSADVKRLQGESPAILIHLASTFVGRFAVRLALDSLTPEKNPYRTFVTASQEYHEMLKKMGVQEDQIFDYNDPLWHQQVFAKSRGIDAAIDCIVEGDSTETVSQTFKPTGIIAAIREPKSNDRIRYGVTARYIPVGAGVDQDLSHSDGTYISQFPESGRFPDRLRTPGKLSTREAVQWREFTAKFFQYLASKPEYFQLIPPKTMPNSLDGISTLLNNPAQHQEISTAKLVFLVNGS